MATLIVINPAADRLSVKKVTVMGTEAINIDR